MKGVNKVIIIGRLAKDPEMLNLPNCKIATLLIPTTESWNDKKTGAHKKATEWHKISVFDQLADFACNYLKKGSSVYIEGQIHTRKYKDKEGFDRYATGIRATNLSRIDYNVDDENVPSKSSHSQHHDHPGDAQDSGFDDDIPF